MLRDDDDELFDHYRHTLETRGKEKGMQGLIFYKSQNKFQDPACGTGGFLLAAHDYVVHHNPNMSREQKQDLKSNTFKGWELVQGTARLCAMNMMLYGHDGLYSFFID